MSIEPQKKQASLLQAFRYAFTGIAQTVKNERNITIELAFAVFAVVASIILVLEPHEWAIICVLIVVVLAFELANSALESLVDLISPATHPLAKHAKDAMAGAVLVVALGAVAAGLFIFITAALRLWGS